MKQKIIDFPLDSSYDKGVDPSSEYVMNLVFRRMDGPGWISNDSLAPTIEDMIRNIQRQWGVDTVYGLNDNQGHDMIGYCNFLGKESAISNEWTKTHDVGRLIDKRLFARISFGPEYKDKEGNKKTQCDWDRSSYDRLHIGVYGMRIIHPEYNASFLKNQLVMENVYFSMRWIHGKFIDHTTNLLDLGELEFFEPLRTTYFWSLHEFDSGVGKKYTAEEYSKNFPKAGLSKGVSRGYDSVVANHKYPEKVTEKFRIWQSKWHHRNLSNVPKWGYDVVLKILSKHGDVSPRDFQRIKRMTPEQGTQYFLDQVIPAVTNFVECRTK
ncbi:MAG: hypothetical protein ACP5N3_01950 [Candidatus Nanoarchaeia archaeon]